MLAAALALMLGGCIPMIHSISRSIAAEPDPGPFPQNYRAILIGIVKSYFPDPYTLVDVSSSDPVDGYVGNHRGWLICLRANSTNRHGHYDGLTNYGFLIRNGEWIATAYDLSATACRDGSVELTPDRQLEHLR